MTVAALAYVNQTKPCAALNLPELKKALRASLAGPVLFYRERKIAFKGSSADCRSHGAPDYIRDDVQKQLFGFLGRCIKDGGRLIRAIRVFQIVHARNAFIFGARNGFHAFRGGFAGFSGRFRKDGFIGVGRCGLLGTKQRKCRAVFFLGHRDCGCSACDQNKTGDGHCDFAAFGSAHGSVSLASIKYVLLKPGRDVSRVPLIGILRDHCEGKRDQMWVFQGLKRVKTPQSSPNARVSGESFFECIVGPPPAPGCP